MLHTTTTALADPMKTLQDRWYNGFSGSLRLSPSTFQLIQPAPPLAQTNAGLWSAANVLPPCSLTFNTDLAEPDPFFTDYAAMVGQQQFPQSAFEQDIGAANYAKWNKYLATLKPPPTIDQLPTVFQQWAAINAPNVAAIGTSDLTTQALLARTKQALAPYQGPNPLPVDFTTTFQQLLGVLNASAGEKWQFDSSTASSDVRTTWTGGADTSFFGVYGGASSVQAASQRFARARVAVTASFDALATLTTGPGAWYNSSVLNSAYSNSGTPPWATGASPSWTQTFGPNGSMLWFIASLVVADGATFTVTSAARYSADERASIQAGAAAGLWPLFSPSSDVVQNTVSFGVRTGLTMQTTTRPGNPLVVGANVLGVAQYLGQE